MAELEISSLSDEAIRVPVAARDDGVVVDPTSDPVAFAFTQGGSEPGSADWHSAAWDVDVGPRYAVELIVGPNGTVTLGKGRWSVWVRITHGAQVIVRRAGGIRVR